MEAEKAKTLSEGEHTLPLNFAEKLPKCRLLPYLAPCRELIFPVGKIAFAFHQKHLQAKLSAFY
jgi:hypothetical protein